MLTFSQFSKKKEGDKGDSPDKDKAGKKDKEGGQDSDQDDDDTDDDEDPGTPRKLIPIEKIRVGKHHTVCPRNSDPFYIVTYYIKWGHHFLDRRYDALKFAARKRTHKMQGGKLRRVEGN